MKQWFGRHILALSIILVSLVSFSSGIIYLHAKALRDEKVAQAASDKQLAELDSTIAKATERMQKVVEARRKAEANAKEKVAAKNHESTASQPSIATETISSAYRDPSRLDVIVNKKHPLVPLRYIPPTVTVSCAGNEAAVINPLAAADFKALCKAAKAAGVPIGSGSSYRSYDTQVYTYNHWVKVNGSQTAADRVSARPGYSEHQTGLTVDFRVPNGAQLDAFTGTAQQKWLAKNGWKYGWIQRYTSTNSSTTGYDAESWHYRYVGRTVALSYTTSSASSLEAFWGVSGGLY